MKSDFFSVLTPIASTADKAVEFVICSSDRRDRSTHKKDFLSSTSSFILTIGLETFWWFLQSFPNLIQAAGTFSVQKD